MGFFEPNDFKVLELLSSGYSIQEIVEKLEVSEEYVRQIITIIEDTVHDYQG